MRKIRNKECHLFENSSTSPVSEIELLKTYKVWLIVVKDLSPETRKILDDKWGGSNTINEIISYLSRNCNVYDGDVDVDTDLVDWFYA